MSEQDHGQFTVYVEESAIPGYQRAWVWGAAAALILLCGLIAGWLFSRGTQPLSTMQDSAGLTRASALLTQQERVNAGLRERIARLERAASTDPCGPLALEELSPALRNP